jgi:D-inositol-3-phosphate glycosyltransferase
VIAARVGGLITAVSDGISGVLIDGHEPADYARALRELIADPSRRARYGEGGRRHAAHFGWSETVDRVLEVYSTL